MVKWSEPMEMRITRDGLILHLHIDKLYVGTLDLKKHLNLSDEEAKELLVRLDEEVADAECR